MNFIDDGTDNVEYECINKNLLYGNDMNMYLIIIEVKYGAIDANNYTCHGYYIIKVPSSTYNLQSESIIDSEVIYSGGMV